MTKGVSITWYAYSIPRSAQERLYDCFFRIWGKPLGCRGRTGSALLSQLAQWREHANNACVSYTAADIDEANIGSSVDRQIAVDMTLTVKWGPTVIGRGQER